MIQITKDPRILAKVWNVKPSTSGKYIDVRITTSERGSSGEYIDSTWFPRLIGDAMNNLKDVKAGDWIIITKAKITNHSYKDKNGTFRNVFNFVVFEAEKAEGRVFSSGHSSNDERRKQQEQPEADPLDTRYEDPDDDQPW